MLIIQAAAANPEPATHLGLKASEWIMIAAIIVGPLLAVATQFIWQRIRHKRDAKQWVFSTMMSLRATPLHLDFIRAANSIDVIFYKNEEVRNRWAATLAHLTSDAYKPENFTPKAFERFKDLLAELLSAMADDLGYRYDHMHFKEQAWFPKGVGEVDEDMAKLRKGLVAALEEGALNVRAKA